jgi:hypothetical protein
MDNSKTNPHEKKSSRSYSGSELLFSNFLNFATYTLGSIIMFFLGLLFLIIYVIFCVLAIIMFLKFICSYCPSFGKSRCPSGYGRLAAQLFSRGDPKKFSKMFKLYIPFLSIIWFLPLIGSLYLLYDKFDLTLTIILILFIIIGFVALPYYSRVHSCKKCPNRKECPWREKPR